MQIIPLVGETIVSSDTVSIQVNPRDAERAEDLVLSTSTVTVVKDERTFRNARDAMGQLKSMLNEIAASEKGAKEPFSAIVNKISQLARDVGSSVKAEHDRIQLLTNKYVAKLELEAAKRREQARKAQAEAEAKIRAAQREAALAKSETEKLKSQLALAEAQIEKNTVTTAAQLEDNQSLVPGGRVTHPWRFTLEDPYVTLGQGGFRLLRIDVDYLACQDAVRAQLETNPDQEPSLPGIKVSREIKVIVKATAHSK
jgi:multidrug efflux pump subunit AcrA (membrane-fusion protein)